MLSKLDMTDIIMIDDRRERDAAIDKLSDAEAKDMLKSLVSITRRLHDKAKEAGEL